MDKIETPMEFSTQEARLRAAIMAEPEGAQG